MRVLVRPAAPDAAAWEGWAVRRDWLGGHEFVGYRLSEGEALEFALVDQRLWVDSPGQVAHSVVLIDVVAFELHADGGLCTSAQCPTGTALICVSSVTVGEVR